MKLRIICAALAVVFACAMLFSTAPADRLYEKIGTSAALIRSEYKNILAFFGDDTYSTDERGTASAESSASEALPARQPSMHTEVIPSPFNSYDKPSTVASVGGLDLCGMGEAALTDAEKLGYTAIPAFIDRSAGEISRILTAHGVPFTTVTRTNTAPAGEVFAIRYSGVSDSTGYYIDPKLTVTLYVSAAKQACAASSGDDLVYLTFDDGPSAAHTEQILDILDTYGIKGAFFTLGTSIESHPSLAAEVIARGHALGCHTMTHVYDEIYSSAWALENEVTNWEKAAEENGITLGSNKIFRFPGGSVSDRLPDAKLNEMKAMLEGRGYKIYDWNVSANDAVLYLAPDGTSSYDYIKQSFSESLELCLKSHENRKGEPVIVLMHESADETPELLRWIIESVIEKGLSFGNISDLGESWMFSGR